MNLYKLFILSQIGYLVKDYLNQSWILQSDFNYLNPDLSILNIAMPSAVSYYYISILSKHNNYTIRGNFPNKDISYQSSITFYDLKGNLIYNDDNKPYYYDNFDNNEKVNYYYYAKDDTILILRYYLNRDIYYNISENWLLDIYQNQYLLNKLKKKERIKLSEKITIPLTKYVSNNSYKHYNEFIPFYLPNIIDGLFPSPTHFYLVSYPGNHKALLIKGKQIINKDNPYFDFITVNQINTNTNNGIPFYNLPKNYNLIVADNEYEYNGNLPIIRWNKDIKKY